MSAVYIAGCGAVSPAGWNLSAFRDALGKATLLPSQELARPGLDQPLRVMRVPPPVQRPQFLAHPRLRRSSGISQFALAAALEALDSLGPRPAGSTAETGVIVCVFSGCVNYSRRFYDETLRDPATASPLVFPETVFNAPASHISACLGSGAINYTLVGDIGTFLIALAIAGRWLLEGKLRECLVVGTEEIDWLSADALRLFHRSRFLSEGAGALLLSTAPSPVLLEAVTGEFLYSQYGAEKAIREMNRELGPVSGPDLSGVRQVFGEGLMAAASWQAVAAADALLNGTASEAAVRMEGLHQHAIGAKFSRPAESGH